MTGANFRQSAGRETSTPTQGDFWLPESHRWAGSKLEPSCRAIQDMNFLSSGGESKNLRRRWCHYSVSPPLWAFPDWIPSYTTLHTLELQFSRKKKIIMMNTLKSDTLRKNAAIFFFANHHIPDIPVTKGLLLWASSQNQAFPKLQFIRKILLSTVSVSEGERGSCVLLLEGYRGSWKKSKCLCFVTNQRPLQTPPSSRNISVCKAGNRLSTEESMRNSKPTIHIGTFYTDSPYPPSHNKQIQAIFFLLFSASEKNQHTHTQHSHLFI